MEIDTLFAEYDSFITSERPPPSLKINQYACTECTTIKIFGPEGFPTCPQCGIVDLNYIDDGPEWISSVAEDGTVNDSARCGMPQDLDLFSEAWGTGTIIATKGASYAMKRAAMINFHSSMNHRDRALFHAYNDIDRAAVQKLGLKDNVVRDAKVMWRKFTGDKLTRGAIRKGIKANCVMYACKLNKVSRTTKEIADAFDIPTKDISRTSQIFKDVVVGTKRDDSAGPKITTPHDVLHRLLNEFDIPEKRSWRMKCLRMADDLQSCVQLMGKTPTSVASVIILKVLNEFVTKGIVCQKCNISLPTLNKIEVLVNKYLESKPTV
jgi:transcription initiation factor TFIIIB Brf1 subunit/transcription initiation factor TFIIB